MDRAAWSRNGLVWSVLEPLVKRLLRGFDDVVFDSEVMVGGSWGGTGAVHRLKLSKKDLATVRFHVFDALSEDEYAHGGTSRTLRERRAELRKMVNSIGSNQMILMPARFPKTTMDIKRHLDEFLLSGYEGAMVKDLDSGYAVNRRVSAWIKLKQMVTEDGVIVGLNEGHGKMTRMVGTISVLMPDGKTITASGRLDYATRRRMWENQPLYMGRYVEVEYQDDEHEVASRRFRQFIRFRPDLDEQIDGAISKAVKAEACANDGLGRSGGKTCSVITIR
jgi:ATP-dependent DNA ligase